MITFLYCLLSVKSVYVTNPVTKVPFTIIPDAPDDITIASKFQFCERIQCCLTEFFFCLVSVQLLVLIAISVFAVVVILLCIIVAITCCCRHKSRTIIISK